MRIIFPEVSDTTGQPIAAFGPGDVVREALSPSPSIYLVMRPVADVPPSPPDRRYLVTLETGLFFSLDPGTLRFVPVPATVQVGSQG